MKNSKSNWSRYIASLKIISLGLLLFLVGSRQNVNATPISISFQVFYDELSPYGDWIEDPNYGFIWVPYVDQSFQPYSTNGHWVMSTYGNTWVSQYNWGWAPFHYGRWFFSDFYGWAWIPGYEWGPAWVSWRSGRGYYGWVPLGPQRHFYRTARHYGYSHWIFVPRRRLLSRKIHRYFMHGRNVNVIYNQTTIINNTYVHNNVRFNAGPSRAELQRATNRNVPVFTVKQGRRPGRASVGNNSINLYKPQVSPRSSSRSSNNVRPKKYVSAREYSNARSTMASPSNRRSSSVTNSRSNNVRSEALKNSNSPASRSARSTVSPSSGNTNQRTVSPNRTNRSIGTPNASRSSGNAATNRNKVIQNRTSPSSSSSRSSGVINQPSIKKPSAPTQRREIRNTPRNNSNSRTVTPSTRNNSRVQKAPQRSTNSRVRSSNNSSRSQTRSTVGSSSRSSRSSSSATRSSSRSTRGN
ncbi:DUF6600 domain-containing protein [Cyclobacterium marinum]|uniref:DUF6600 domain-containing protein n=1 Tax=Cyclobacterium marinum TaxID=104 RepID=UPI0011EBFEFE|nr:DUF6600 domain-containing protein [Cyclobacterium marinum]MBI0399174.1 hypothetical protein [Cyclobacterium marinum]